MGKIRHQRKKYHLSRNSAEPINADETYNSQLPILPLLINEKQNIFADVKISFNDLKKTLNDDTKSVKSFKSFKSEISDGKRLSKKDKIALRHEFILNKINVVEQARKSTLAKKKREQTEIIGDLLPLRDALPALETLIQSTSSQNLKSTQIIQKKKPIEKRRIREKNTVKNVKTFRALISNKEFKKNPLKMMTEIIKSSQQVQIDEEDEEAMLVQIIAEF
ncbi:protein FAM207A [Chrysoperla carnea]|uniref:protein FAM207A n=1 Tax=Chrysoperla carnea TaxID=189513 RepID=UPI001D06B17E|nr:protein FAM207A [Chrysoperla carnea]